MFLLSISGMEFVTFYRTYYGKQGGGGKQKLRKFMTEFMPRSLRWSKKFLKRKFPKKMKNKRLLDFMANFITYKSKILFLNTVYNKPQIMLEGGHMRSPHKLRSSLKLHRITCIQDPRGKRYGYQGVRRKTLVLYV